MSVKYTLGNVDEDVPIIYLFVDYLLCAVIKGKEVKLLKILNDYHERIQLIINLK